MIWRPVLAGKVTLTELENHYSVEDLFDLCEAMDIHDCLEHHANKNR